MVVRCGQIAAKINEDLTPSVLGIWEDVISVKGSRFQPVSQRVLCHDPK